MSSVCRSGALAALVWIASTGVAAAQQPPAQQPPAQQQPPAKPEQKPGETPRYEETVVVSASKAEERLVDAPATMSVVTSQTIEIAPSQNFAELLRAVPGVNITQVSARDINITTRAATGTLATGQLALLDGRSLYQDFFGFVMWDFLPVNFNEVKQIEVIRGPASAIWGANAFNGVVNVITKSPREMQGTGAVFGIGGFDRVSPEGAGTVWYVSGTHAQAVDDRWAYKLSAGGYSQDPLSRPTGVIPCDRPEVCTDPRASYPGFANQGTTQPKFDARVDYDFEDGRKLTFSGGVAGTDGIMHSGIGPFDIDSGTVMGYIKATYSRGGLRANFFTNILNGDASNLLSISPTTGLPIPFEFKTNTYDFELSNVQAFAGRHVVSYGGNLRFNFFDLSIAPSSDDRLEFGVYGQDEIFLSDMFRWVIGARLDRFDYIDDVVFSPRTTFMIKPRPNQTFRVSYNRAYRSPSVINNHLNLVIAEPINLSVFGVPPPYLLPVNIVGNPDLDEQLMDAFEIGYSAAVGRAVVSAAFYTNWVKNEILFTEDTTGRYTAANPPANWPLPPGAINLLPGRSLPGRFTYLNFGRSTQQGFELGVQSPINANVDVFANYSWQGEPDPKDFDLSELNLPPTNRFNAGVAFNRGRFHGNLSVSFTDDAFWQDVLDARYSGTTDAYTLVNGGFGVRWADDRVTTSIKIVNLGNVDAQQHIFGDTTKRQIVGEVRVQFDRR
ncbi:MAG TPA: TonB-dependent receptor [Vicinamibacterales bacterium]|nr:TonB-dependent receptor [Vicinamibacterales bacterium]